MEVRIAISCIPHPSSTIVKQATKRTFNYKSHFLTKIYSSYLKQSTLHPYRTSMLTGGAILTSADVAAQYLTTPKYVHLYIYYILLNIYSYILYTIYHTWYNIYYI